MPAVIILTANPFSDENLVKKFNQRISRYGRSATTLVNDPETNLPNIDTFGLTTKVIGRPENWDREGRNSHSGIIIPQ